MASTRMLALLGLLAVAGYQHRDQLGALLGRVTGQNNEAQPPGAPAPAGTSGGGLLSGLGSLFGGGSSSGGGIAGGLSDLIDHFTGNGHGDIAKSWVETGPNATPSGSQLEQALGEDSISALTQQTGLSRSDLLSRLSAVLPQAVDKMTPEGRLPTTTEASSWNLPRAQATGA
jgi:uncharacterized protein YidB (DUF937 family)